MGEINQYERRELSQHGEDGIIEYLLGKVGAGSKKCVEFGVGPRLNECNTAKLVKEGWDGLFIDSSETYCQNIVKELAGFKADAKTSWITRDNINTLVPPGGDFQLISADMDGVDYWVFEAIKNRPAIFIVEYNETLGDKMITVPYKENFDRMKEKPLYLYHGASLSAMVALGKRKGYRFVGVESCAVNAFFVREDLAEKHGLAEASRKEALKYRMEPRFLKKHGTREHKWAKIKHKEFVEVS